MIVAQAMLPDADGGPTSLEGARQLCFAGDRSMIFITGDTHGSYKRLRAHFRDKPVTRADTLVILGDTGLNYHGDERDMPHKRSAARLPLTLLCLRGNHDRRPASLPGLRRGERFGGRVYWEDAFPHVLYADEAALYDLEGRRCLSLGGAYSIDKAWRLAHGYHWFPDEQLSPEERNAAAALLDAAGWRVDMVLSHTCPLRYEPAEAFFAGVDQRGVDKSMETWLDGLEARLRYRQWFCGHFHIDKTAGPVRFVYRDVLAV